MTTAFKTKLSGFGNNTGIEVPKLKLKELGASKRPPVTVNVNRFIY